MRNGWLGLLVFAAGCSDIFGGCEDQTKILEVDYGSPLEDIQYDQVTKAEAEGWDCVSESIRNAFGGRIGTRYTCTRCV